MSNQPSGRHATVVTDDGVPLSVREYGPVTAPVTAVFAHGHCLRSESWHPLRDRLSGSWGPGVRMVFYDHRGHGRSGHAAPDSYTIDRLGRDLGTVIGTRVPHGPVVLIGHSMGGMVAMACVRQNPTLASTRLAAVALISTAAGGLAEVGLGRMLRSPALSAFHTAVRLAPRATAGTKRVGCGAAAALMRFGGSRGLDPRVLAVAAAMAGNTSVVTMSRFLQAFVGFDEFAAVPLIASVPSLVLCGSADLMTPFSHSMSLAERLPLSELVRVDGAGHSVILERVPEVAAALDSLVTRVGGALVAPAV
ncbi:alpha/beta fold hydrolase [Rhodococcus sp. NPDC058505]|uniref:alpha/beta fold hydrolase n=1 Tax=unclassified Rhodococcus (in: high G+C Gram-positive bacteria) TaxID=192944 RepID=UPI00366816A6